MMDDPIVEETRKAGEAYLARFGFDLNAVAEDLRKQSERSARLTVTLPPRLVEAHQPEVKKRVG